MFLITHYIENDDVTVYRISPMIILEDTSKIATMCTYCSKQVLLQVCVAACVMCEKILMREL